MATQTKGTGTINDSKSRNVYDRAEATLDALDAGAIDVEQARAKVGAIRVMSAHVKVELEHAKLTGRLAPGSADLPGFRRTGPVDVPPEVATGRLPRRQGVVG